MAPRPWTVLPHKPIVRVSGNLWLAESSLPRGPMNRIMSIIRLTDGRLVFHNAVPLDEPSMKEIEAFGKPAFLLVPNGFHRLDIHAFKARYPGMKLLCPPQVKAKVGQNAEVDGDYTTLPKDANLTWETLDGGKAGEAVFLAHADGQSAAIFGDAVMNMAHQPGFGGFIMKLLGSSGGPRVTLLAKLALFPGKAALAAHLQRLAALPGMSRIIPSHGEVIANDAPGVLKQVAAAI